MSVGVTHHGISWQFSKTRFSLSSDDLAYVRITLRIRFRRYAATSDSSIDHSAGTKSGTEIASAFIVFAYF